MAEAPDHMVVYSDYVCPFCYLGKVSAERYAAEDDDAPSFAWRPFDLRAVQRGHDNKLDPSIPDGKTEDYFARAKEGVRGVAEELGVDMKVAIHRNVDSFNAHLVALKLARVSDEGVLAKWHDLVFDALWQEGQDIGDIAVLRRLAKIAEAPPDVVDAALTDDELVEDLRQEFKAGLELGITGVPTFVYGRYGVPGAVPPESIAALVHHVRNELEAAEEGEEEEEEEGVEQTR